MSVQLQLRNDTTTNWTALNPVLALGEFGYDSVLKQHKIGDGVTHWLSLPWDAVGPQGTPGTASVHGTVVMNFGALPGDQELSVAVSDATISGSSVPHAYVAAVATSDHTISDHQYAAQFIYLTCSAPTAGVGFTIYATCAYPMVGTFNINWNWV